MSHTSIFKKINILIVIFLSVNFCKAEYDVYCMGGSYTVDSGYIQSMADSAGIELKAGSSTKGNMRDQSQLSDPLHELATGTIDALVMTAMRPFRYTEAESKACISLSQVLLEKNSDARIFIHDYWTVKQSQWSLYPQVHGWDNVRALHLGSIKSINLMAHKLKHKVYAVPVAAAIQLLRENIIAGKLEDYKNADEILSDSIHLSEIGRYIQSCLAFCGAYKYDVRKLPGDAISSRNHKLKFSTNNAKIIHEIVYETVRNTPYSGWYKNEPESIEQYLKHLQNGLKNWESFDKFYPASGTGTFIGDNNIEWNYTNIRSDKTGEILTDAFIIMNRDSFLWAKIPGGIADLHFAMHNDSEIEVLVNGESKGIFRPVRQGNWSDHYFKIKDLNKTSEVIVMFISRKDESKMDNISWTSPIGL